MSKVISIGTAVPAYAHEQEAVVPFLQRIYALDEADRRKLRFLSAQSGIRTRYSVIADYSLQAKDWTFYPPTEELTPFPSIEQRMEWYARHAASLSMHAIQHCLKEKARSEEITHLITVSCTGMSAPGLDLELVEALGLAPTVFRTSVNFMGCYAAIHALKLAAALSHASPDAKILIVCTELCTLHFQQKGNMDNILSSLLFGDGAAAALVVGDTDPEQGVTIDGFYSTINTKGKKDMAWNLSSTGFQMMLSSYIPELIEADFATLVKQALGKNGLAEDSISHWCIHPGGRKILDAIRKSLHLTDEGLTHSYDVLSKYGNMSSATILFVLQRILAELPLQRPMRIFGAAFGPGLTMETFVGSAGISYFA